MRQFTTKFLCCFCSVALFSVVPLRSFSKGSSNETLKSEVTSLNEINLSKKKGVSVRREKNIKEGVKQIIEDTIVDVDIVNGKEINTHETKVNYEITPNVETDSIYTKENIFSNITGMVTCHAKKGANYVEDDACGFRILCYSTIKWKTTIVNNNTYIGITSASGGVKSLEGKTGSYQGGGVYLQEGKVDIVQNGAGTKSLCSKQKKSINTPAKPHTWSFTPSDWQSILPKGMSLVGLNQQVKYKHTNGVTYTLDFDNYLVVDSSVLF